MSMLVNRYIGRNMAYILSFCACPSEQSHPEPYNVQSLASLVSVDHNTTVYALFNNWNRVGQTLFVDGSGCISVGEVTRKSQEDK